MIFLWLTNDPHSEEKLKQNIAFLNERHAGKQVTYRMEMVKNRPVRSVKANRRYWAILTAIGAEIGETKERLHYAYALMFIPDPDTINGQTIPLSTTDLSDLEMSTYMKKIEAHARDFHGITLANPSDESYIMWERMVKNSYDSMFKSI